MTRGDSRIATTRFDRERFAAFARRFGRGCWLAFLALALLTASFPATVGLTIDRSPAVTSKLISALAISRQDIPSSVILDSRSKLGWSRTSERSGAVQSTGGNGIVPVTVRMADARPYTVIAKLAQGAVKPAPFRHFDAQAPPLLP